MNLHLTRLITTTALTRSIPFRPSVACSRDHSHPRPSRWIRLLGLGMLASVSSPSMLHAENAVEDKKFDGNEASSFGIATAVSGDVALVGAPSDTGATLPEAGAAYIYRKDGANWTAEEKLTDPNGQESDFFGLSVAVSGAVAIVGAPADDDFGEPGDEVRLESGSAFVFRYNGTTWELEQKLTASDAAGSDLFGFSVAISGNVAVVGADEQQDGPGGSAYVFRYDGTTWNEEAILKGKPGADDNFGISVAVSGNVAMVGASPAAGTAKSGSAHIFRHTGGGAWTNERELTPSVRANGDRFGESVSISGTRTIVAAPGASEAYIYHNTSGTIWSETRLTDSNPSPGGNNYGYTVAISGEVALVTAPTKPRTGSENVGSGFLYRLSDTGWLETELLPSDSPAATSGWSAALSQDYGLLGTVSDRGAAYVYNLAPEITWNTPEPIVAGTLLSSTQLNASSGAIPGTFLYSAPINEELPPGRTTVTAFFTPTDAARYAAATAKVDIVVFTPIDAVDDLFVLPLRKEWIDGVTPVANRTFLPLENDQFANHSSTEGYSLRFRKVDELGKLSETGESRIVIAQVGSEVRIRIFDGSGAMAFDLAESELIRGQFLDALRNGLSLIDDNHVPTTEEIGFFTYVATYLTGFSPGIYFEVGGFPSDTLVTATGATVFTNGVEMIYSGYKTTPDDDSFIYHIRDGEQEPDSSLITIRTLIPGETEGWGDYGPDLGALLALAGTVADQGGSPSLSAAAELYRDYPDELFAAAVNYPSLGGGLPLGYPVDAPSGDGVPAGKLLQIYQALQEGLIALVLGNAEEVAITAEMAEITRSFMETLVAFSSDAELGSNLATVLEVDEAEIIGMSFAEFATANGLDPKRLKLRIVEASLDFPSYSVTILNLPGITYTLSMSPSLAPGSWQTVPHTETIDPAGTITLTDPNTPGGRAIYRVVMEATPGLPAAASD